MSATQESSKNGLQKTIPFLIFLISLFGVILPYMSHGALPGDIGDGRFNRYVLEHFYLVILGKENLLNAPFFYPWVQTISFSDNHWGSGLIYVFFRSLFHFSPEKAYKFWFCLGLALNYWAAYFVNRALGLQVLSSAIAAFFFSFALPVLQQDGHTQLMYRLYVPLAFWAWHSFLKTKDPRLAALTFLFLALQFLISMYTGVFLCYFLAAYFIAWRFFSKTETVSIKYSQSQWLTALCIFIIATGLFLLFAIPYLKAQQFYGFHRSWNEIKSMLPTFQSYFIADNSKLWLNGIFPELTTRHERSLFIGIGASLLFLYAIFSKTFASRHPLSYRLLITVGILSGITLLIGESSLYRFVAYLPGFSAVRAVARIIVVLVFPISLIIGEVLDDLVNKELSWIKTSPLIALICFSILLDSILADKHVSTEKEWKNRMLAFEAKIKQPIDKDSIIIVKGPFYADTIDSMIYAQMKGIKTMSGYSGNQPNDYLYPKTCQETESLIESAEKFSMKKLKNPLNIDKSKIIYVGFDEDCSRIQRSRIG